MGKDKQQPRIGDIRKIAEEYFIRHGRRLTFRQALLYYRNNGGQYMPSGSFVKPDDFLPDNAFVKYIDNGIIFQADQIVQSGYTGKIYGKEPVPLRIRENDFINKEEDIAVYIHVPYINDGLHSHDHFEINYVYKGTGYFSFSRNGKERMAAKELLESTNIPISRICEIIGYSSPEHFSRIFKREYQVSPSDYRKSIDFSGGNEKGFEEAQNKRHKDCVSFPT